MVTRNNWCGQRNSSLGPQNRPWPNNSISGQHSGYYSWSAKTFSTGARLGNALLAIIEFGLPRSRSEGAPKLVLCNSWPGKISDSVGRNGIYCGLENAAFFWYRLDQRAPKLDSFGVTGQTRVSGGQKMVSGDQGTGCLLAGASDFRVIFKF